MRYVRAQEVVAVRHPEHGGMIVPLPAEKYRDDDPLVKEYPWLFAADDEPEQERRPSRKR